MHASPDASAMPAFVAGALAASAESGSIFLTVRAAHLAGSADGGLQRASRECRDSRDKQNRMRRKRGGGSAVRNRRASSSMDMTSQWGTLDGQDMVYKDPPGMSRRCAVFHSRTNFQSLPSHHQPSSNHIIYTRAELNSNPTMSTKTPPTFVMSTGSFALPAVYKPTLDILSAHLTLHVPHLLTVSPGRGTSGRVPAPSMYDDAGMLREKCAALAD